MVLESDTSLFLVYPMLCALLYCSWFKYLVPGVQGKGVLECLTLVKGMDCSVVSLYCLGQKHQFDCIRRTDTSWFLNFPSHGCSSWGKWLSHMIRTVHWARKLYCHKKTWRIWSLALMERCCFRCQYSGKTFLVRNQFCCYASWNFQCFIYWTATLL